MATLINDFNILWIIIYNQQLLDTFNKAGLCLTSRATRQVVDRYGEQYNREINGAKKNIEVSMFYASTLEGVPVTSGWGGGV